MFPKSARIFCGTGRELKFFYLLMAFIVLSLLSPGNKAMAADITCYVDADGDGYGDPNNPVNCAGPLCDCQPGLVSNDLDCDDSDPTTYPGATEFCDGVDNDCNGTIDDNAIDCVVWYEDSDGDGYGGYNGQQVCQCDAPPGYVDNNTDCDDFDVNINPAATEICNNIDDDCNSLIDDNAIDCLIWYPDNDGDGYGDINGQPVCQCDQEPGYAANNTDCDDADPSINPGAAEVCDLLDNDCNGTIDDNPVDCTDWYPDADGDGYGASGSQPVCQCDPPPGYASNDTDCDDGDASINPGAEDIPGDSIDQDCDGSDAAVCCDVAGDANNDGAVNLGDAGFIINYIFYNGPAPTCTP